jgi:hypothetical protein
VLFIFLERFQKNKILLNLFLTINIIIDKGAQPFLNWIIFCISYNEKIVLLNFLSLYLIYWIKCNQDIYKLDYETDLVKNVILELYYFNLKKYIYLCHYILVNNSLLVR